jgi:DNA polymerase III epsilon subunit-like protein
VARNPEGRIPAHDALHELTRDLYQVDCVIAHNLAFDKPIIQAACARIEATKSATDMRSVGWPSRPPGQELCTMEVTRTHLKIPATAKQAKYARLSPYKSPSLRELFEWLHHGEEWDGPAHTAMGDVGCLAACVEAMLRREILEVLPSGSGGNKRTLTAS